MTKYTNHDMEAMLASLEPLLGRRDIIGYAAARNTRILQGELVDYILLKDELIKEHGEPEKDADGNETGRYAIDAGSEGFGKFAEELGKLAGIEHEPNLFRVPFTEAIGRLSGTELLETDWMFEE